MPPSNPGRQPELVTPRISASYANFVLVSSTPEEVILDSGLNVQPIEGTPAQIEISQRLVMNYYTAKRLWMALGTTLQRHEHLFGTLETDVERRMIPREPSDKWPR